MPIHIGRKIKEIFYKSRIRVYEFANGINKSRNVIYYIFKQETIDTGLLQKIGEVLNHDFFPYYIKDDFNLNEESAGYMTKAKLLERISELEEELRECHEKLEHSKKEAKYLKKINALLEKKRK